MNNPVTRIYLRAELKLSSPLSIASGSDEVADSTFIRDFDGKCFIPGSSLAGALRDYALADPWTARHAEAIFGYLTQSNGATVAYQSRLAISDCLPRAATSPTQVRDMVKLQALNKTAEAKGKFDAELLNSGQSFDLKMELILFEGDDPNLVQSFACLVKSMQEGRILLGAKKSRGWGSFTLDDIKIEKLDLIQDELPQEEAVKRWIGFEWYSIKPNTSLQDLLPSTFNLPGLVQWKIPFKVKDSLLVRSYQDFKAEDAVMFDVNGKHTIPGTSFAGCLRSACHNILYYDLGILQADQLLDKIFGYVDKNTKTAGLSLLVIDDIPLETDNSANYTRTKVDRFTGGVKDGALFTAKPVFKSSGEIVITFRQGIQPWMKELLLLGLQDIDAGIVPLGGETSIGRGLLSNLQLPQSTAQQSTTSDDLKKILAGPTNNNQKGDEND